MLGEGGKKRVHLAHDGSPGRDVAASVLKTGGLDESGQIRVRREAGEILVSEDVLGTVGYAFSRGGSRELTLKGFSGTHTAHTVGWA